MVVVVRRAVKWVQDSVSSFFDATSEGMIVSVVVVISHINLVLVLWLFESPSLSDCDLLVDVYVFPVSRILARIGAVIVDTIFNVDLCTGVSTKGFAIAARMS